MADIKPDKLLEKSLDNLKNLKEKIRPGAEKEKVEKFRAVSTHALREMGSIGREIARSRIAVGRKVLCSVLPIKWGK